MTEPQLKHPLKKHFVWNDVKQKTIDRLNDIPQVAQCKHDPEIILLTCNIVENQIANNNPHQLDKKELVCEILNTIFDFEPHDIEQLKTTIDVLHDNEKIKKLPRLRYVMGVVFQWIKSFKLIKSQLRSQIIHYLVQTYITKHTLYNVVVSVLISAGIIVI